MRADRASPEEHVAQAIVDYLQQHSLAADSVEGVARWWLGAAHAGVTNTQVERALDLLVARDIARRVRLTDGTYLYSLAPPTRQ